MTKLTLVTGLWNIKRDELSEGWSRSFQHYLDKFEQLLQVDNPMIIFGDEELESFVNERRNSENTLFVTRSQEWFKNEFYDKIQNIRTSPDWYNLSGWLSSSTQAKLEMYNPLVMSKMFLLNDAKILDKFDSEKLLNKSDFLILEGVGSGQSAFRNYIDFLIWIDINPADGLTKVISRDGTKNSQQMQQFLLDQERHFALENTQNASDWQIISVP